MELLIVLGIIALTSALVIPRIGNQDNKLYQAQLRTLMSTMNYNRRNAVILNRPFKMRVYPLAKEDASKSKDLDKAGTQTKRQSGDWKSQGANISWQVAKEEIKNKPFSIQYFPQGGASGGTMRLQQGRFIAILKVSSITGKTTLKESVEK